MSNRANPNTPTAIALGFLGIALLAYILPWNTNAIHSLNLGAYDLAEWLSLHPATQPLRVPSLLLRGQLVIIAWLFALEYAPSRRWLWIAVLGLLVAAQLPPLDFITRLGDTNQQQQFILALVALPGVGISVWLAQKQIKLFFVVGLAGGGIIIAIIGALQAQPLIAQYQQVSGLGVGMPMLVASYVVWIVWNIARGRRANRIAQ